MSVTGEDARAARVRMAEATRRIIDELVSSTAEGDRLEAAAGLVEQAIAVLAAGGHGRSYTGVAEGSLLDHHTSFVDHSPLTGPLNPLAPPLSIVRHEDHVVGEGTFGPAYEGPPGCVHGGYIAAAFDEVLGFTQSLAGQAGMTVQLDVTYRAPTPLHRPLRFVGRLTATEGRRIHTHCTLHAGDTLCAEATAMFVALRPEVFQRLMASRRQHDDG